MWELVYDHLYDYIGAYMFLVLALMLFTGLPVAIALGGVATLAGLLVWLLDFGFVDLKTFFQVVSRVWGDGGSGAVHNPILVAIPCFVFMGTMLEKSKVAENLLRILQVLLKRVPGGLALSVTVMGTIMAATTGIIGASVVMITLLALPTMLGRGYSPSLATGTIASSATLGILIPPSIMLVLMANLMTVSVGNLFIGAILPGLVLSSLYFVYIVTACTIKPSLAPKLPPDAIQLVPSKKHNIWIYIILSAIMIGAAIYLTKAGFKPNINWGLFAFFGIFTLSMIIGRMEDDSIWGGLLLGFVPPIFLIVMVLGSIFGGWATPTEAAGVGAFGAIILAMFNGTFNMRLLKDVVDRTTLTTAMIFFIFVGATAFSTIFRNVYGEDLIIEFIEFLELGPWPLLILLMAVIFLLGFFFDFLEIILIILPVFAPVIKTMAPEFAPHLGIDPPANAAQLQFVQAQVVYWFAILVATNLQTSFLTPPFGFALFYMKGVAPSIVKMQEIYRGIIPFVLLQIIGILTVLAFPGLALWLPELVFGR